MIKITYHNDGSESISRDGESITPAQLKRMSRKRVRLHGGIQEMVRCRKSPTADTDEVHTRINRSGLSEREKAHVARQARKHGLNEHCAHDPTVPGQTVYESRRQVDEAIQSARDEADREEGRPVYRLHPELVADIKRKKLKQDPSLAQRDQRELEEEIIETHGLPE